MVGYLAKKQSGFLVILFCFNVFTEDPFLKVGVGCSSYLFIFSLTGCSLFGTLMESVSFLSLLLILSAFQNKKWAGTHLEQLILPFCFLLNRSCVSVGALLQVLQKTEMDSRCKQAIMRVRTGLS